MHLNQEYSIHFKKRSFSWQYRLDSVASFHVVNQLGENWYKKNDFTIDLLYRVVLSFETTYGRDTVLVDRYNYKGIPQERIACVIDTIVRDSVFREFFFLQSGVVRDYLAAGKYGRAFSITMNRLPKRAGLRNYRNFMSY